MTPSTASPRAPVKSTGTSSSSTARRSGPPPATTPRRNQQRKSLKKVLNDALFDKVKSRTQGSHSARWAIADAGATGHFVMAGVPVINVRLTTNPIRITLPNGQIIVSTHTCNLNIPWLPAFMTEAYIVPGMAHSPLISIRKLCDGGCKVKYNETEVRVIYKEKHVLSGR